MTAAQIAAMEAMADEMEIKILLLEPRERFDPCILGVCQRFNDFFVVYDQAKVIETLMADGMDYEAAQEHFSFNIVGAWVGEGTPAFVLPPEDY